MSDQRSVIPWQINLYQFCAIHTADTTDNEVTNLAHLSIESEKVHRLYPPVRVSLSVSVAVT